MRRMVRLVEALFIAAAVSAPLAAQNADVQITSLTDSPDPITLGLGDIAYTVVILNAGPHDRAR